MKSVILAIPFLLLSLFVAGILLSGCSVNGKAMRFSPTPTAENTSKSWFINGEVASGTSVSCSFVEFDERGDFIDFSQHLDCEKRIEDMAKEGKVLLFVYCHGWKNNSQSGDVAQFNAFLCKLAQSSEIVGRGFRVHGVYLGWRGNVFKPYVDVASDSFRQTEKAYGAPIIDPFYHRSSRWTALIPENLSYWRRKRAAEHLVSALPIARAIFTYASAAKGYGTKLDNKVCVMGHSFGALLLEKGLGQAMTGALTMEWWNREREKQTGFGLPFDFVLFVNSAAPAIYAKEMRDFLKAYRSGLVLSHSPNQDVPVIVSITSTADMATGVLHPIGNLFAPLDPSLKREYTCGIVGLKQKGGTYPIHPGIRQSKFYTKTPGHHPYLINHWIKKESAIPDPNLTADQIFTSNLNSDTRHPDVFSTSKSTRAASTWRLTTEPQGPPVLFHGLPPSMSDSDYWIVSCGKEIISGHNDIWSQTAMETYAGIFRAVESRRAH